VLASKQPIYTYNLGLTESEFLNREFLLELTELTETLKEHLIKSNKFYVATANPSELDDLLEKCEPKSAVIFYFGNETYDVPQFQWLNRHKVKVKHAFIYNLPRKTSFIVAVKLFLGALADGGLFLWSGERNIFRNFKNGIDLMKRTRKLDLLFPHSDFPQGYSRRFVAEAKLAGIKIGDGSILDLAPLDISLKGKQIGFVGQNGSWCRELAIKVLKNKNIGFMPTFTHGWGGENQGEQTSYIDSLIQSELTLNPPGNLTNRTHRYLESLVFNSLPIMPPSSLQDPHLWGVWSESRPKKYFSWRNQIKFGLGLSEDDRKSIILEALMKERARIDKINYKLNDIDVSL
jgi:hypothetical protein